LDAEVMSAFVSTAGSTQAANEAPEKTMRILRNCWYAAGWAGEVVAGTPLARRIADLPVLFFRREDGDIAAIADYCPHRFAPLHRGKQIGDYIRCGYHGLEFDGAGKCVHNPHKLGYLPKNTIPSYSIVTRYGVIWIWMGDEEANPELINREFAFLEDPKRGHVRGRFHVKANYLLMLDNLMDISHALYLHGEALMTEDLYKNYDPKVTDEDEGIKVTLEQHGITAPLVFRAALPSGTERVDFYDYVKGLLPANVSHDIAYTQLGQAPYLSSGVSSRSAHLFTPESKNTTHYFFDNSRDFMVGDAQVDERMLGILQKAFGEEDIPMIEAQQKVLGDADLMDLHPLLLSNDRAAVLARRKLTKRIEAQKAGSGEI
jgi:phenylpropionate dioxygenase-like ring-hydroxylating dioxygenase large terminal subunit